MFKLSVDDTDPQQLETMLFFNPSKHPQMDIRDWIATSDKKKHAFSERLTSTRSPSLSSRLAFFCDSGSERFDADSVEIWLSAAIVFMLLTWPGENRNIHVPSWRTLLRLKASVVLPLPVGAGADSLASGGAGGARLPWVPFMSFSASTVFDSFDGRVKIPLPSSHWKYRTPATEPSFFPMGSSRTIPAHWPGANCVPPMKCT